ncbi:MAG TPA: efflux transporter outer membrane subunit [Steroidobacteraceae bacterium]|nr:efflux transporter outer membrane subunit [Steroidobacteraceae bacterium]
MRRTILVISIAAALSGCIVSRVDPQKPELPLPASLPAVTVETVQLPDPWWTIFGDPVLNQLVDEALQYNTDVAIAASRVAQARAALRGTNANRLPTVDLEANYGRSKQSADIAFFPGADEPQSSYSVQGAVGYELDLWGRYQRASEAARAELLNSEYGREATKLGLTGDVARGYFALMAAAEQLARGRDTLATREESLRLEKLRLDAGESDEFTFKRAEADAEATRTSVFELELEVTRRVTSLGVLLGRSPKDLVERAILTSEVELPDVTALPAALPSTLMERRPDIGAAEALLNASAADIGVARAELFPRISLTGAFGSASRELGDLFTQPTEAWSWAAGLVQPIFEGGRLRANVSRAEAVREQRKAEYARTVQEAFREVLDGLNGQRLIDSVRDSNSAQVAALSRATELAELRYNQGDIAFLELLDVRRGLFQAQIEYVAAQRDALLNTVDLALAVGGGLGNRAEPLSANR